MSILKAEKLAWKPTKPLSAVSCKIDWYFLTLNEIIILLLETPWAVTSFFNEFSHNLCASFLKGMDDAVHHELRFLALGCPMWVGLSLQCPMCLGLLLNYTNLREIILVTREVDERFLLLKEWKKAAAAQGKRLPTITAQSAEGFRAMMDRALAINPF